VVYLHQNEHEHKALADLFCFIMHEHSTLPGSESLPAKPKAILAVKRTRAARKFSVILSNCGKFVIGSTGQQNPQQGPSQTTVQFVLRLVFYGCKPPDCSSDSWSQYITTAEK
jgi:hypothetical protein